MERSGVAWKSPYPDSHDEYPKPRRGVRSRSAEVDINIFGMGIVVYWRECMRDMNGNCSIYNGKTLNAGSPGSAMVMCDIMADADYGSHSLSF